MDVEHLFYKFILIALIAIGICELYEDLNQIYLWGNLKIVWSLVVDPYHVPPVQFLRAKYLMSFLIVVRFVTFFPMLLAHFIAVWPIIFDDRVELLLPIIILGMVRLSCYALDVFECMKILMWQEFFSLTWIKFFSISILNHVLMFTTWIGIMSYKDYIEYRGRIIISEKNAYKFIRHDDSRKRMLAKRGGTIARNENQEQDVVLVTIGSGCPKKHFDINEEVSLGSSRATSQNIEQPGGSEQTNEDCEMEFGPFLENHFDSLFYQRLGNEDEDKKAEEQATKVEQTEKIDTKKQ